MACVRARFVAALFAVMLAASAPLTGCAALFPDAKVQAATDALTYSAVALRMLNTVAEKQIDSLDLPTPEQLEQAASVVRDLQRARHAMELAEHDAKADDFDAARAHVKDALLHMRGAADTLKQLGADVSEILYAIRFAERFL